MTEVRTMTDEKLVDLLFTREDRLPKQVVDEFLRRPSLVPRLAGIVSDPYNWNEPLPRWWAVVHAVYILGAVATQETVLPLLKALRYSEACENDWVTEDLPAIFGRVGPAAVKGLKGVAADRTGGWLARALALEGLAAIALLHADLDEEVFLLIRGYFEDSGEERPFRQMAGHILLDFLRTESRESLTAFGGEERALADKDAAYRIAFTDSDVDREFRSRKQAVELYTRNWLLFYEPDVMAERGKRWDDERRERAEEPGHATASELCPFDTTGKRKKCCMGKVGLA
ncbi:MAG: hypothetical protein M0042_07420 [Nitrospiraceae bacterium]|nr:hypothetical protein [Nitrospiraceae bacterium]